jgi:hypothetical protein
MRSDRELNEDVVDRYRDMILLFDFWFLLGGVSRHYGRLTPGRLLYVSVDDVNVDLDCA